MQDPEGVTTLRPDEHERVLAFGYLRQLLLYFRGRLDIVTIDAHDDVSFTESGVIRGAAGNHALNHGSMHVARSLQLLTDIGRDLRESYAPAGLVLTGI